MSSSASMDAVESAGHCHPVSAEGLRREVMRIRLDIRYDGTPFHGWAAQPGLPTLQGALESALAVIYRQTVELTVAGRTDAGVHASGQVAHFTVPEVGDRIVPPDTLAPRLGAVLRAVLSGNLASPLPDSPAAYPPNAVDALVVTTAMVVPETFDARFSALARHYVYRIVDDLAVRNPLCRNYCWWYPTPLDAAAMNASAAVLLGEHDFAAFCKPREGATTIRTLQQLETLRTAPGMMEIRVRADAFCHSMVRSLVGALTEVGRAKRDTVWLADALAAKARIPEIPVAPALGLTLTQVDYPQTETELLTRQQTTRARRDCGCPERR